MSCDCNESFKAQMRRRDEQRSRMTQEQRDEQDRQHRKSMNDLADRIFGTEEQRKNNEYEGGW